LRRVTLRPCNTGFDEKMKAKLLGIVIVRSERGAAWLNRFFEPLSWVFFILMLGASFMSLRGVYLFYTTGSCNGVNSSAFCVFDPTGKNNDVSTTAKCTIKPKTASGLSLEGVNLTSFPVLNPTAPAKIVMIGCYHCDYTREAYPPLMNLIRKYNPSFTYISYPTKEKDDHFSRLSYCVNKLAPQKYWQFNDQMFTGDKANLDDPAYIDKMLTNLEIDAPTVNACISADQTKTDVSKQLDEAVKSGFYGTPTIFINSQVFVGPKPPRVYAIALEGLLYWLK
jgi:protein-disulfide isomerase